MCPRHPWPAPVTPISDPAAAQETHVPTYGDDLQGMWGSAVDAWAGIYAAKGGDVCMEEAKSIACPTLVLHGAKDPICLTEHPHWFKENIPGAQLEILPDGKHNVHVRPPPARRTTSAARHQATRSGRGCARRPPSAALPSAVVSARA